MSLVGTFNDETFDFPLRKTNVAISTVDDIATVTTEQTYYNNSNKRVESFYRFPLYRNATINNFTIEFTEGKIKCKMQELEEAKKTYSDAVAAGNKAAIMSEKTREEYDVTIGNIDPEETVIVNITYLVHLLRDVDTDGRKFILPTTITPRYDNRKKMQPTWNMPTVKNPPSLYNRSGSGSTVGSAFANMEKKVESHEEEILVELKEKLEPNVIVYSKVAEEAPINIKVSVVETRGLECVILPKWNGKIVRKSQKDNEFKCELESVILGEDFVLKIIPKDEMEEPVIVWAEDAGDVAAENDGDGDGDGDPRYTLKIQLDENSVFKSEDNGNYEFIFLIDRSGSMMGDQIENAKRALDLMMNAMPMNSFFNIYGFGSTWKRFYPKSVKYDQDTFKECKMMIPLIKADMGGTDMNEVLDAIYSTEKVSGYARKIILLTDGEVYDVESLLKIVDKDLETQIFTIGVGNSVSHELVNGLAERSNGQCEIIMDADLIERKILRQMKRAMYKSVKLVIMEKEYPLTAGQESLLCVVDNLSRDDSYIEISIGDSETSEVYGVKWTDSFVNKVDTELLDIDEEEETEFDAKNDEKQSENYSTLFSNAIPLRLQWVEKRISEMKKTMDRLEKEEEREETRKAIVSLSLRYGVLSNYTSFVGVLETERKDVAQEMVVNPLHPGKYDNNLDKNTKRMKRSFYSGAMQWSQPRTNSFAKCGGALTISGGIGFSMSKISDSSSKTYVDNAMKQASDFDYDGLHIDDDNAKERNSNWTYENKTATIIPPRTSLKAPFSEVSQVFSKALQFDGSLSWILIKDELDVLENPDKSRMSDDTWATLLFMAYLTVNNMQDTDGWKMTLEKTMQWIAKQKMGKEIFKKNYEKALETCG